ncbi:urea transporter [Macrolepiota fuliginosa MF-IS2]|uniref:Urea transporter n=1 Tax=Macrolepiota fuliginosa MF-IS2 TaxID=1400762 RepID=A0A9P5XHK3_9AGAR|nr:urea transporter [Macrolepiota fuliginosa MF-IS2]
MSETAVLPQGAGYGVVIGIGLFFSAFMIGLTALQARYTVFSPKDTEEFNTASRSVKPGLIASGIVSAWTWSATLLQSSAVAYEFGISGPWWYGAGATVQILLFAMLAAKLKMNAPYAHTWLEIVGVRWGKIAHLVFMFLAFATNITVSCMLILGGSATVTDLTGMNTVAACFLIPIGVAIYVMVGGMRSTLLCDYTHTTILFIIIFVFVFTVYTTSPKIGSLAKMHELLTSAASATPVAGNAHGSYLTMKSTDGIIFGVITLVSGFANVFQDQAYWQRAIASRPATTVKAYLLGGLTWFAIPFTFATTLGLAAVALRGDPDMRVLTPADVSAGLPAAAAATALLGKGGAVALLVVLFLAITSACSAELIGTSSLLTYDVYVRYFNPKATEEQVFRMGHYMIAFWAIISGLAGTIFFYIGISMGWLYTFMGVILGSGVVPVALCMTWSKANKWGCIGGPIAGFFCALMAWLVTTATLNDGVINVETTGGNFEMLAGNVVSIGVGGIVSITASLIWPGDFDWEATRNFNKPRAEAVTGPVLEESSSEKKADVATGIESVSGSFDVAGDNEIDLVKLKKAFRFATWSSVGLFVVLVLLIPLPLFGSARVYDVKDLTVWVAFGIAWTFLSAFTVVLYPLYESRTALVRVAKGIVKDIFANGSGRYVPHTRTGA